MGFVATSDITREPTCSWCNRPLTRVNGVSAHWLSLLLTNKHTHSHTHMWTDKFKTGIKNPQPCAEAPPPKAEGRRHPYYGSVLYGLGCRNAACRFISVHARSLFFCLWMLSSCSPSPAPLPRLLQRLWDLLARRLLPLSLLPFPLKSTCLDIFKVSPSMNCAAVTFVCFCIFTQTHTSTYRLPDTFSYVHFFWGVLPECLLR